MRIQPTFTLSLSPLPSSSFGQRTRVSANNLKRPTAAASDATIMKPENIFDKIIRFFLSTLTFLIAFYATTLLMSFLFPLDSALLGF